MNSSELNDLREATENLAVILMNYYLELKKVGFSDGNAIRLTSEYQNTLIGNSLHRD